MTSVRPHSIARLRELARLCRADARRSSNPDTKKMLLAKAEEYERMAEESADGKR